MRPAKTRFPALAAILAAACLSPGLAQDKPGPSPREVEAQNRAIRERMEQDRRREAARYARIQESIRVQADSGACLASHLQRATCLLTAAQFNRFANGVEPDGEISAEYIREVRRAMIKELLRPEFLADRMAEAGLAGQVAEAGMAEEKKVWEEAANSLGHGPLRVLYARYRGFFAAREERTYEVLASTDSALVDSLHRSAARPLGGEPASRGPAGRLALPWARVADSLLPAPLAEAGRKLRKWRSSRPLRWGAGWAVLRPAEINRLPAIPYEDALPSLLGLSNYAPPDSAEAAAAALAHYRGHPRAFATPDTLLLEASLDPGAESDSGALRPATPLRLSAAALPEDARRWLHSRGDLRPGMSLGPVHLGMGWWTFRVLEAKPGKGGLPFAQVRDSLAGLFIRTHAQGFMAQRAETLQEKRRDRGMRIFEELATQRNPLTAGEIAAAVAADSAGFGLPPGLPEDRRRVLLERLAASRVKERKWNEDFSAWLDRSIALSGI